MAQKTAAALSAFDVLLDPAGIKARPVCVIVGDDGFLQHEVRRALAAALAGGDVDAAPDVLDGETAAMRDVLDALREMSLFGGGVRIVVVTSADKLVTNNRERLEDYVAQPRDDAVLILEVQSWPATTRLAKAVAATGLTIKCQAPDKGAELTAYTRGLKAWLAAVAKQQFGCDFPRAAVDHLLELAQPEPGMLYQEVSRLSLLAGAKGVIDAALVRDNVGGWRTRKTWDMIDAAADGRADEALEQLRRLLAAGEEPHGLLPQTASSLRKFALAVRLFELAERRQPITLRQALERAGVPPFKLNDAERQLKQIGRARARQLYRQLLAADLATKDYNSSTDRARRVLETLIIRLSQQAAPVR